MRPGARVQHRVLRFEVLHFSGHQKSREVSERPSSAGARSPLKPLAGSGPKQRPCPSDVCAEPGCPGRRPESPARNGRKPPASPDPLGRPLAGAASEGGGHCGGRRAPLCPAPPRPGGPPRCAGGAGRPPAWPPRCPPGPPRARRARQARVRLAAGRGGGGQGWGSRPDAQPRPPRRAARRPGLPSCPRSRPLPRAPRPPRRLLQGPRLLSPWLSPEVEFAEGWGPRTPSDSPATPSSPGGAGLGVPIGPRRGRARLSLGAPRPGPPPSASGGLFTPPQSGL